MNLINEIEGGHRDLYGGNFIFNGRNNSYARKCTSGSLESQQVWEGNGDGRCSINCRSVRFKTFDFTRMGKIFLKRHR